MTEYLTVSISSYYFADNRRIVNINIYANYYNILPPIEYTQTIIISIHIEKRTTKNDSIKFYDDTRNIACYIFFYLILLVKMFVLQYLNSYFEINRILE